MAKDAKRPEDLGNSIRYLFKCLNDFHGFFRYKDSVFRWSKEVVEVPTIYKHEWAKKGNRFVTRQLHDIGYLRVPTTLANVAQERVFSLRDSLCKLLAKKPTGLIFDLRLNGGGHAMAMVMGLSGIVEYSAVAAGDKMGPDGYYRGSQKLLDFKEACAKNCEVPIVVITGPFTGSSAEALTLFLKGRPNTVQIGEPTAGYITSNYGLMIDKANLNIATEYMKDSNGNDIKTKIHPDIFVDGGDDFTNVDDDAKVRRAIEWVRNFKTSEQRNTWAICFSFYVYRNRFGASKLRRSKM